MISERGNFYIDQWINKRKNIENCENSDEEMKLIRFGCSMAKLRVSFKYVHFEFTWLR